MIDYKRILEDKEIVSHLEKGSFNDDSPIHHGIKHAQNVVNVMKKLITLFDIKKPESDYLLIACSLHDAGYAYDKDNHSLEGVKFVKNYLENKVDLKWLNKILSAIETHHQKEDLEHLSLFNHLVLFADKMDFTYKRSKKHIDNDFKIHLIDVNFSITNDTFIVIITSDKKINTNMFLNDFEHSGKIISRIEQFADKLKLNYKILLDDEELV